MTQGISAILSSPVFGAQASLVKKSMTTIQPVSSTSSGEPCNEKKQGTIIITTNSEYLKTYWETCGHSLLNLDNR